MFSKFKTFLCSFRISLFILFIFSSIVCAIVRVGAHGCGMRENLSKDLVILGVVCFQYETYLGDQCKKGPYTIYD